MALSEWFSDDELINQLRMFFDTNEASNIDFQAVISQAIEVDDDTMEIRIKGRRFQFNLEFCDVEEV